MGDKADEDSLITSRQVTGVRGRCHNAKEECGCLQNNAPAMSRELCDGYGTHATHMQLERESEAIYTAVSGAAQASQIVRFIGQMSTGGLSKAIAKNQTLPRQWCHSSLPLSHPLSNLTR